MIRIGALAERLAVPAETIRSWERRYEVVSPLRSAGGYRLYSPADEDTLREMRDLVATGIAPEQAAARVHAHRAGGANSLSPETLCRALHTAIERYDSAEAEQRLDDLLAAYEVDTFVRDCLLPLLADIGRRWECGELNVAQEHFASSIMLNRLSALARSWGKGAGPQAILACAPREEHCLGLLCFGLLLRSRGWRVIHLGANVPIESLETTVAALSPDVVVVSSVTPIRFTDSAPELEALARVAEVRLGGAGAVESLSPRIGRVLPQDIVEAASSLTREMAPSRAPARA